VSKAKVVLNGGEVTTRKDLKELIRLTIKSGNYPVVYTNGLKISDLNYLRELKSAGLKEVVISFEGFREEIYEKLRGGREEFGLVLKALRNLEKEGIRTSIYTTIAKGINDDQVGPILDFAASHKFIWTVSFKPIYLNGVSPHSGLSKANLISYSELLNLIARKIPGINLDYVLSLRKMLSTIQQSLARKENPIYLSWLEIPTIFVRRENGRFKPLLPSGIAKLFSRQPFSSIFKHTLSAKSYLQLDELLYKLDIRKVTLGTISPYIPTFLTTSPTLMQLNNRIVFSSYLAW